MWLGSCLVPALDLLTIDKALVARAAGPTFALAHDKAVQERFRCAVPRRVPPLTGALAGRGWVRTRSS
jgi:hypothetical protein